MDNNYFFVKRLSGFNFPGVKGQDVFLITNNTNPQLHLSPESIICFSENNANAICELINESNSFNPEHDSTSEVKEVLDCLNRYAGKLHHDIVKTVVEEVYSTKREDLHNVE